MTDGKKPLKIKIKKPEGHCCFACGTENPIGLNLQFYRLGEAVCTDITLGRYHEGWQDIAHGGILSTLLDEVMSWAVMISKKTFLVTRKMEIKYVRNVFIGIPLTVSGQMVDETSAPRIQAKGEIRDNQGRLLVKGSGEFVVIPEEKLSAMPPGFKDRMASLFASSPSQPPRSTP
ncbi:MAG: PaaI family thioesterase [Deltaproteobacteria bacterium]|nr:PaaI family thioesterase [Deltaproteobacteria bacterium]